jgi:hypothetical protein
MAALPFHQHRDQAASPSIRNSSMLVPVITISSGAHLQ